MCHWKDKPLEILWVEYGCFEFLCDPWWGTTLIFSINSYNFECCYVLYFADLIGDKIEAQTG